MEPEGKEGRKEVGTIERGEREGLLESLNCRSFTFSDIKA